ncbi:DUF4097 family beta strand repeat-containing protein [Halomarina litorea]|uniref:DUF4097 family beta strand repeat-containing protein n=1 Tax=Halomarina litorea TaxID=2961595 RepID=UPI0020C55B9A|nr:DUF4097 family beta strand repeat-containing protein [Halomarina sp. BCD28]
MNISKRQYIKAAGVSLAALSLGVGGTISAGNFSPAVAGPQAPGAVAGPATGPAQTGSGSDRLDYERDENGNLEFDFEGVSFETDDGDIDLDDVDAGVSLETTDGDVELTVSDGDVEVSLEMSDGDVEVMVEVGGEMVDFERNDTGDIEFEAEGNSETFEDDDREIEYKGDAIQFEYDDNTNELDVSGDVKIEHEANGETDFEYADDNVSIDYDGTELEYVGETVSLEWNDGAETDFEARRV